MLMILLAGCFLLAVVERVCRKCHESKEINEFLTYTYVGKVYTRRVCKKCRLTQLTSEARKRRYTQFVERRATFKKELLELMGGQCFDCKQIYPFCCYDFHHLDPNEKEANVAVLLSHYSIPKRELILKEVKKCILLCANCHRLRTWGDDSSQ